MFNTITKFTLIGLATVAISSCSSDIEHAERHPLSSKFLKVSGNVNALSRATSNSWESGDKIGITGGDYKNVAYTTTGGTSTFTAVNSEEAIKIEPDATTEFRAYYPFNDDTTGKIEIPFNVVDQEGNYTNNPSSIDFMFAKSNASNGAIEFDFSHSLSNIKLTLVVKYIDENGVAIEKPAEMESVTATDITIAGITTTGSFNTTNGAVITGGESGSIKTRITTDGTSIIVPEQILTNDLVITTTFGDKQHKANIRPELKPGYQYSYTLTYNVKIESAQPTKTTMSISQSSISPWTEGTGGNVDFVSPDGAAGSDPGVTPELPVKVAAVGDYILKDGSILPFAEYNASRKNDVAAVVYYVAKNSNELTDLGFPYPNGLAIALRNTDEDIAFSQTNGATLTYLNKFNRESDWINFRQYYNVFYNYKDDKSALTGYALTECYKYIAKHGYYDNLDSDNPIEIEDKLDGLMNALNKQNTSNKVNNASSWYLPSIGEFKIIEQNFSTVSQNIIKVADYCFNYYDKFEFGYHWTSNEFDPNNQSVWVKGSTPTDKALKVESKGNFLFAISF